METTYFDTNNKTTKGLLIKILYAKLPLSIQVHPDDKFAKILENEHNGKSESWYILEANEQSKIVLGLKNYDLENIKNTIEFNLWKNLLSEIKINKNDFYDIPAGLVHGLGVPGGAEIKVIEVQQPSDITYRFFDYNRKNNDGYLRELHINKALKVIKNIKINSTLKIIKNPNNGLVSYKNHYSIQTPLNKQSEILKAWNNGYLITYNNQEYCCYEIEKGESFLKNSIFFVETIN
ncbi:type I phosphomannose isomerase catalytic subunit [Mycoplasmopsis lipofaciens]|uniref:type I phosphomannose isomerase catalytic subunit n=1 Tax=Mycoplasmopsis lipofaciens TaxID=114884 RepID=UPI000AD78F27|nr:type I phosphomannose isomerase catalytic subunit [Mycoplasmopsis lipofaciens]